MKKPLLLILVSLLASHSKAQVVFCPPGAEWSYNFRLVNNPYLLLVNEKIIYSGDTILGSDTLKILKQKRAFLDCNTGSASPTLIKQSGDTIFMQSSRTNNQWEILYNFNVQAGDDWKTTVKSGTNTLTYTISVDSVGTITTNGMNLKRLFVKYNTALFGISSNTITERFGCNQFMFNYANPQGAACDLDGFYSYLCYKDSQFGSKQFTNFDCDYNTVGLENLENENNSLAIYPNPTSSNITIENKSSSQQLKVVVSDPLGKTILKQNLADTQTIDVSTLQNGIYFLQVFEKDNLLVNKKIVKE